MLDFMGIPQNLERKPSCGATHDQLNKKTIDGAHVTPERSVPRKTAARGNRRLFGGAELAYT
jgi:hypothetical protein